MICEVERDFGKKVGRGTDTGRREERQVDNNFERQTGRQKTIKTVKETVRYAATNDSTFHILLSELLRSWR